MTIHSGRTPRVVVTGAAGFIGWHTQVRLRALGGFEVVPISHEDIAGRRHRLHRARPPQPVDGGTSPSPDPADRLVDARGSE